MPKCASAAMVMGLGSGRTLGTAAIAAGGRGGQLCDFSPGPYCLCADFFLTLARRTGGILLIKQLQINLRNISNVFYKLLTEVSIRVYRRMHKS